MRGDIDTCRLAAMRDGNPHLAQSIILARGKRQAASGKRQAASGKRQAASGDAAKRPSGHVAMRGRVGPAAFRACRHH
ncbi:hypothetical protein [Burkholderia stabilis]|uniref:hypothetical protein n=1 Tax=Burkholderia stabilis TaxID=95485 RepID=UPI00158F4722|nr:hypothetical protein [Burkholderia stabilis]